MRQRIARTTKATARTAHASAMPPSRLLLRITFDQCAQGRRQAARAQPTLFPSREEGQGDEDREIDHSRNHADVGQDTARWLAADVGEHENVGDDDINCEAFYRTKPRAAGVA